MIFSKMANLNKVALVFFVVAKFSGILGVSFGFLGPDFLFVGGCFLSFAIFSIFLSVILSIIQSFKDKKTFEEEDQEEKNIKKIRKIKFDLENEILALQEQKRALSNLMIKKGRML